MSDLLAAFGLFLIIEGIMPLVAPGSWKEAFRRVLDMREGQLRFIGLASILIGLAIFTFSR